MMLPIVRMLCVGSCFQQCLAKRDAILSPATPKSCAYRFKDTTFGLHIAAFTPFLGLQIELLQTSFGWYSFCDWKLVSSAESR